MSNRPFLDLSKIPPMTEREAEELYQRTVVPSRADVEYALSDLPQEIGDVVRRYIARLEQRLLSCTTQNDLLDRLRYSPGNGDMGG